jgi:hypothetical protein
MALPKLDNTQIEKNQQMIIQKMDGLGAILSDKLVPTIEKMTTDSTVDKMFPFVVQIADNIYNIAGKLEAQVTSMKEVRDAIEASKPKVDEGAQIEAEREKQKQKVGEPKKEEKKKTFLERLGEIFEKILIPLVFGFVVGLSKALGGFESTIGKVITIFAALYLALSGFRKKVNELVVSGFKKLFSKPAAPPGAPPQVPGAPGKAPGAPPGAPGTPDMKPGKPGKPAPSGLDNFLKGAQKVGKSIKDLFVGIADTIAKVLGKLAGGIKDFITKVSQGIKNLLQNIAKGIESFGKGAVLKGAAALVVVSSALFIAAKAFKEFGDVKWEAVAKGLVGITGLIVVMKLLDKGTMSMIKGAAALTIMSGALFLAGKAFQQFAEVDWKALAVAAVGIAGLAGALLLLGPLLPGIALGAVSLTVMSAALAGFGAAIQVVAAGLPAITQFVQTLASIDGTKLLSAAAGITAVGAALAVLGGGQVIQALGNFVSGILSFGKEDIFTKLTKLGEVAGDLNQLPSTIEALGKLSNFKVSNDFMKNVDMLSTGLKKIAESAQGFEKTGDSLTALAKIAEVMNKPAPGGAQAPGKPGAAPGQPPAAGKPVAAPGQPPAAGKPVAAPGQAAAPVQAAAKPYSQQDIQKQEQLVAQMEKSGNKSGASSARARLQNMQSQNKQADTAAQMTPEQRRAVAEGKPITPVSTAPQGTAMNADSQKVAAAQSGGGTGGGQTNIVAPQSSVVNAPQSQTVNAPLSAYGIFGGRVSTPQQKSAAF